jgi:phosphoglycerate dehydrogenase-like enzyme
MAEKYKILYLVRSGEPIYEIMRAELPKELELVTVESDQREEIISRLKDADFTITVKLDGEMIRSAPKLKLIQLAGVGYDGVDVKTATSAGIPVAQTIEGTIIGVAEHTILLILSLYKQLTIADSSMRRGEWLIWQLRPTSYTLNEKTVGIVGLGRIGREVAARAKAFGTKILYTDVVRARPEVEKELGATYVSMEELVSTADIVSLHCPLTSENKNFFGEKLLRLMKPSSVFINTARGDLVDEPALIRALSEKWIAGAGLDVFNKEPIEADNPLLKLKNTIVTPHMATGTRDSVIGKTRAASDNFLRVLRGERPENVINQEVFAKAVP